MASFTMQQATLLAALTLDGTTFNNGHLGQVKLILQQIKLCYTQLDLCSIINIIMYITSGNR